jgi:anti-sigma factor RsiW
MSHQPFEKWIFENQDLNHQEKHALEAHLETCKACSDLAESWQNVEQTLQTKEAPQPQPGFTRRFQARLSIFKQQQQQRRMWILTISIFAIASLILSTLFILNYINTPLDYALGKLIAGFSLLVSRIAQLWTVFQTLTTSFPLIIPIGIVFGIGLLSAMLTLIVTWFLSVIKLYQPNPQGVL